MKQALIEKLSILKSAEFIPIWYEAAQSDHFWMKSRFDFVVEGMRKSGLPMDQHQTCLDIGAGAGIFRNQIEAATTWTVDCADLDEAALSSSRPSRGRNLLYDITERRSEFLGKYDIVFLMDVIEHIEAPLPFLTAAIDHLKQGGYVVVNVPALPSLFSRYDECAGHIRRYTADSLIQEMITLPVDTLFEKYWGASLVPVLFLRKFMVQRLKDRDAVIQAGFNPARPWINALLSADLFLERKFMPWRPFGTSLIYIGKVR